MLATCLTKEGEQSLKSVTSDRLKTFQMDVTNSKQIKDVFDEVERRIPDDTGKRTYLKFIFYKVAFSTMFGLLISFVQIYQIGQLT